MLEPAGNRRFDVAGARRNSIEVIELDDHTARLDIGARPIFGKRVREMTVPPEIGQAHVKTWAGGS